MTFDYIKEKLQESFPGCPLNITNQIGGQQVSLKVWNFIIEVSFCEKKVAVIDVAGEGRVTFKLHSEKDARPLFTKTTTVRNIEEFDAFTSWAVSYLTGIVATIEQAFVFVDRSRIKADIFSDDWI